MSFHGCSVFYSKNSFNSFEDRLRKIFNRYANRRKNKHLNQKENIAEKVNASAKSTETSDYITGHLYVTS